jgi:hypothetical protein
MIGVGFAFFFFDTLRIAAAGEIAGLMSACSICAFLLPFVVARDVDANLELIPLRDAMLCLGDSSSVMGSSSPLLISILQNGRY